MSNSNEEKTRKGVGKDSVAFEKLVSKIQQRIDPNALVSHNEILTDRLGQRRQFDVVIRGSFAGQDALAVIECKHLRRNVGIEDIESFVTKSNDINANFRIVVSKQGFTKKALHKAKHYGIQTLSLFLQDNSEQSIIGTRFYADIYRWKTLKLRLDFVEKPIELLRFEVDEVLIEGKKIIDWYKNYLTRVHSNETKEGWIAGIQVVFSKPRVVQVGTTEHLCAGIIFGALRTCERKARTVGWSGEAFYDWQKRVPNAPPKTTLSSDAVPMQFDEWDDRGNEIIDSQSFLYGYFTAFGRNFEICPDAIDLDAL